MNKFDESKLGNLTTEEREEFLKLIAKMGTTFDSITASEEKSSFSGEIKNKYVFDPYEDDRWTTSKALKLLSKGDWVGAMNAEYSYLDQFRVVMKKLNKANELQNKGRLKEAGRIYLFYKPELMDDLYVDYADKLEQYLNSFVNQYRSHGETYVLFHGKKLHINENVNEVTQLINSYKRSDFYKGVDIFDSYNKFKKSKWYTNRMPTHYTKVKSFVEAFKGYGAFYSLRNIIKFHEIEFQGIPASEKDMQLELLDSLAIKFSKNKELYKLHGIFKDVVFTYNIDIMKLIKDKL